MFPILTTIAHGIAPEEPARMVPTSLVLMAAACPTHVLLRFCEPDPAFVSSTQTYHVSQATAMFVSNGDSPHAQLDDVEAPRTGFFCVRLGGICVGPYALDRRTSVIQTQ